MMSAIHPLSDAIEGSACNSAKVSRGAGLRPSLWVIKVSREGARWGSCLTLFKSSWRVRTAS